MSIHHRRHARRQLDGYVRASYHSLLLSTARSRRMYTRLLHWVRLRSTLLDPIGDGELLQRAVSAIAALARYHGRYVAPPETWAGGEGNIYELVHSLAEHLLGRYPVPRNLAMVWLEPYSERTKLAREWFITHALGTRFRAIETLPMAMTRKIERIWIQSPHHLSVRQAMRRAELLALGAEPALAEAVLSTRVGDELEHGEFWRGVMHWLVNYQAELSEAEVVEVIEFVDAQRFRAAQILAFDGATDDDPPQAPEFSLAGRTPASLARLIDARHEEIARRRRGDLRWMSSGIAGFLLRGPLRKAASKLTSGNAQPEGPRVEWKLVELLDSQSLRSEGHALHHCVAIYAKDCYRRRTSIWSLRRREGGGPLARRYTIEVELATRRIVQVRGHCNILPRERVREFLASWAELAGLQPAY